MRYEAWYAEPSTGPTVVVMALDAVDWWEVFRYTGPTLASCVEAVSAWIAKGAWHADPWPHRMRTKTQHGTPRYGKRGSL